MNKSCSLFSTFFLLLLTYTYGQSKQDKQLAKALDQILSGQFKPTEPGGALLIAKKGEVVYEKGFGLANLEWNVPINPNTVFQIGSITKLFTALAILQLSEKTKIVFAGQHTKIHSRLSSQRTYNNTRTSSNSFFGY